MTKELLEKYADAESSLNFRYHAVTSKNWKGIQDIKQTFNRVNYVDITGTKLFLEFSKISNCFCCSSPRQDAQRIIFKRILNINFQG